MRSKERKSIEVWIKETIECETYQSFISALERFEKAWTLDKDMLVYILFSYVWKDVSSETRFQVMMDYVSYNPFPWWFVYSLCSIYDPDKVYESFEYQITQPQNRKRKKKMLADFVSDLKNGLLDFEVVKGYDEHFKCYYICKKEIDSRSENCNDYHLSHKVFRYFQSFGEFLNATRNDLSNSDLRNAPIKQGDLENCLVDETTHLPLHFYQTRKKVRKYYDPFTDCFVVRHEIVDSSGSCLEIENEQKYKTIEEFVAALNKDLSNADLAFYARVNELKDISSLNLTGARLSSELYTRLGVDYKSWEPNITCKDMNPIALDNETDSHSIADLNPNTNLAEIKGDMDDEEFWLEGVFVHYISDIHFDFKIPSGSAKEDVCRYLMKTAITIRNEAEESGFYSTVIIAGDTAIDVSLFELFVRYLKKMRINVILTLGNHELRSWKNSSLRRIKEKYEEIVDGPYTCLLQNDLCYLKDDGRLYKISQEKLERKTISELKTEISEANVLFFGGIGFDSTMPEGKDWYNGAISSEENISEAKVFEMLYHKVCQVAVGRQLVVCSHMPKRMWETKSNNFEKGIVYISGHTHKKVMYDDGSIRIFADNQIGYKNDKIHLKTIRLGKECDKFAEYEDGIYDISIDDYVSFMRGKCLYCKPNRRIINPPIHMLKKHGIYCFAYHNKKGELAILQGGKAKKLPFKEIQYLWDNMGKQIRVLEPIFEYYDYQKIISQEIRSFGGDGQIHGCIVDISFYCHLYIVPKPELGYPIIPYFALDTGSREVFYSDEDGTGLEKMLKKYTDLYPQFFMVSTERDGKDSLVSDSTKTLSKCREVIDLSEMFEQKGTPFYGVSALMNKMLRIKKGVLQVWNNSENGYISEN